MSLGEYLGGHALWQQLPGYDAVSMVAQFRRHGLDWQAFLAEGLPAEVLAASGDALALRVIAEAEKRAARTEAED